MSSFYSSLDFYCFSLGTGKGLWTELYGPLYDSSLTKHEQFYLIHHLQHQLIHSDQSQCSNTQAHGLNRLLPSSPKRWDDPQWTIKWLLSTCVLKCVCCWIGFHLVVRHESKSILHDDDDDDDDGEDGLIRRGLWENVATWCMIYTRIAADVSFGK